MTSGHRFKQALSSPLATNVLLAIIAVLLAGVWVQLHSARPVTEIEIQGHLFKDQREQAVAARRRIPLVNISNTVDVNVENEVQISTPVEVEVISPVQIER